MKKLAFVLFLTSLLLISGCQFQGESQESPSKVDYEQLGMDCSVMMDLAAKCPGIMDAENEEDVQLELGKCGIEVDKGFSLLRLAMCVCCVSSGNPACCISCIKG